MKEKLVSKKKKNCNDEKNISRKLKLIFFQLYNERNNKINMISKT